MLDLQPQQYPVKRCLIINELDIMFIILKTDNFQLWFLNQNDLRISPVGKHVEIIQFNTFKPRKTTTSSTLLIRYRFQG